MKNIEYDWIDDAFDDSKPDPLERGRKKAKDIEYDWIDDAFDESKEDPLGKKGMSGCSRFGVVFGVLAACAIIAFMAFVIWNIVSAGASL